MDEQEKQQFNIDVTHHPRLFDDDEECEIVTYEDVIGYQMGSQAIAIMTKDNETVIIPITEFKQVRHYPAAV